MRLSADEYFLKMALLVATRSTCLRRNVGCVLVDQYNRVIGTGYNGVPSGMPHCNQAEPYKDDPQIIRPLEVYVEHSGRPVTYPHACPGARAASGTALNQCRAIHAEINALISCRHPEDIVTAYCTASPCELCIGPLMNTSCRRIAFSDEYPHPKSKDLWTSVGRDWVHHPIAR